MVGGLLWGCDLNVANPNQAFEEQVLTTSDGIKALAIGMQRSYASNNVDAYVRHPAITSRELAANTTFSNLLELEDGLAALIGFQQRHRQHLVPLLPHHWHGQRLDRPRARGAAGRGNAQRHCGTGAPVQSKVLGIRRAGFCSRAPRRAGRWASAQFRPREELFAAAIGSLDRALETATSTPPSDEFNADILGAGFDLINTIRAYRARYHLFTGNYQAALEDADAVDPAATSVYTYDAENENPLYAQVVVADDYAPRDHFGLSSTESGDARLAFYTVPSERTSNPNGFPIEDLAGFWHSATSPIPAYLPGEMALTRAEAHAMLGNIDAAIAEIDAVRTKTPAEDPFGVGAALPPYSGPQSLEAVLERNFSSAAGGAFSPRHRLGRQPALGATWPFGQYV